MKTKKLPRSVNAYTRHAVWCLLLTSASFCLQAQTSYSFTPCGATGQTGPTQLQVNNAYAAPNTLAGLVTVVTQGIQQYVAAGGAYRIEAYGAQGGHSVYNGGLGSIMMGDFNLTPGQILNIVVGQQGLIETGNVNRSGGGGGGSFVYSGTTLLIAAGGGAGKTGYTSGTYNWPTANSNTTTASNPGSGNTQGVGGVAANNGLGGGGISYGGGGAGWLGDGGDASSYAGNQQGFSLGGGWLGGTAEPGGGSGGFGGGGAGGIAYGGGGGGGGYSGGGGGTDPACGGGAGSYNGGTNQNNIAAINTGNGMVVITRLCAVNLTAAKNPICSGESVTLSTDAVSNIVWGHDGSTLPTVNVSPGTNTIYKVIGQAASGCTTEVALTVSVNPSPVLTSVVVPSVLCVGNTATLSASGAKSYTWTSLSVNGATATANPGVSAGFAYMGSNQYNCVTSATAMVNVNTNTLGISSNTSVCLGNSVWISAFNAVTYTWSTGNNFASTPVSPVTNTTYIANGTDIHNCVLTNVVAVTVHQKPNVTAGASKTSICRGEQITLNGGGASTYSWSNGAGAGESVMQVLPVETVYNYIVTGTDANGCTNTATVVVIASKCTGIDKLNASTLNTRTYPNPAGNTVTIELSSGSHHTIDVVDLTGRTVLSAETADSSIQLNLGHLSDGVYYFKVNSAEGVETIKVVKN